MRTPQTVKTIIAAALAGASAFAAAAAETPLAPLGPEPKFPGFSTNYMDRSVSPAVDFYEFADGQWVKDNPVPPDKSRWASFSQLAERNLYMLHEILEDAAADTSAPPRSPTRQVGDLYYAAMDTNRLEELGFQPIQADLQRIDQIQTPEELFHLLADFHNEGVGGMFGAGVGPDEKNSGIYAFEIDQGGLSLPDRDYYLKDSFTNVVAEYRRHVAKMFTLLGENPDQAAKDADTIVSMETQLAKASRTRVELRDPNKNYNKFASADLIAKEPALQLKTYLSDCDLPDVPYVIVGQPEFFDALNQLVQTRPMADWKVYLRWHVLHASAPYLQHAVEQENFNFFGKTLSGQPEQETRWKRAERMIDRNLGEALGELYVKKCFPPEAKARMNELVNNLREVFRDHLAKVPWMGEATRAKALAKFARFTQKIGYPQKFRDYSSIDIKRDDLLGDIRRCEVFESHRQLVRVGKPVDKTEWDMTPPTVNAYFNPPFNEIVFPAGILQPPFFDPNLDDAVNYGGIGVVIGHEITHGYDDQGRKFDADGNLNEWWTPKDAEAFEQRAQRVIDEYNNFEPLPGFHVNGRLTEGENIADLGGVSIAYDALERDLRAHPEKRKNIDGFTPEQRFFISFAQIWRTNIRDAEAKRLVTVDPHSPGRFRAVGPLMNYQEFFDAFNIHDGDPMWRDPQLRAHIW